MMSVAPLAIDKATARFRVPELAAATVQPATSNSLHIPSPSESFRQFPSQS